VPIYLCFGKHACVLKCGLNNTATCFNTAEIILQSLYTVHETVVLHCRTALSRRGSFRICYRSSSRRVPLRCRWIGLSVIFSHCEVTKPLHVEGTPYINSKHAYAGQLNSVIHLRALLVLHNRGIFGPGNAGHDSSSWSHLWPTNVNNVRESQPSLARLMSTHVAIYTYAQSVPTR
jgi:hypothetical protein